MAPDRWASALHLFDNGAGAPHEQTTVERWERAQLLFGGAFAGELADVD